MADNDSKKVKNVAIYIRVSTMHQIDRDSLPMQRKDLIAYCTLILNTENYTIFEDAGYSGKDINRPQYQKMMSQIRSGAFTHLLVWKIDRISRNLLDFSQMYAELKKLDVVFVSKSEQFDTSTAIGEAMLKIILVFAELERNMTSERVKATMFSRANNGLWNGGKIPLGYGLGEKKNEFVIIGKEAELVKTIFNKYEELKSLTLTTYWLNENGYTSKKGNDFTPVSVGKILNNAFYVGTYIYGHGRDSIVITQKHHQAIITQEQYNNVQSILRDNIRLNPKRKKLKHNHIFQGLIVCGVCENVMSPTIINKKRLSYSNYRCYKTRLSKTECKSIAETIIGEFVSNYLLNFLNLKSEFSSDMSLKDVQNKLLNGTTFIEIKEIAKSGLMDIYNILSYKSITDVYGKSKLEKTQKIKSKLSSLKSEYEKLERAMDRLTNLFLYSDEAISDIEYIARKEEIVSSMEQIDSEIGLLNTSFKYTIPDDEFISKASQFIISQKLLNKKSINYVQLVNSIDKTVLRDFVHSIFDSIIVTKGKITSIIFTNGLRQDFIYK